MTADGITLATDTPQAHIADGKTNYAKTDIDDAGAIDGTELAVVLNLITTQINSILLSLENAGILANS